ncbi:hypothetical protein O3M35_009073 [Rhynocoris fuscipes]|uniref:Odorant receptor n=1 Tax=Rhynocoris fuscipes TaxID=488301 RepID=A0AAW1D302_9HEMI
MKFLDNLCSEDDEIVDEVMYNEYWYLPRISCIYSKMDTPKWRALSAIQHIFYLSCVFYHIILFSITAVKLQNDKVEMFQALNYLSIFVVPPYTLILFSKNRKKLAEIHRGIATGLSNYDEETELLRKSLVLEVEKKRKIFMPMLLCYFTGGLSIFLPLEKYLNSYSGDNKQVIKLSPNMPINLWVPYDTNSQIGWSTALFLFTTLCAIHVLVITTGIILFFVMCEYIAMEVRFLIHSLNRLPERTLHLYRLRHGDNTNVSIETMKENTNLSNCYRDCLKKNIIHHQNIIR